MRRVILLGLVLVGLLALTDVWAFNDATLLDSCVRANENPLSDGGKWTSYILTADAATGADLTVTNNVCVREAITGNASSWRNDATYGPDVAISATMPDATGGTGNSVYLCGRLQNPGVADTTNDGYCCTFLPFNPLVGIIKLNDNSFGSNLASTASFTVANGDEIGCEIIGTTIKAWVNLAGAGWTEATSYNSVDVSGAGRVGVRASTSSLNFNNFGACTLTGGVCAGAAGAVGYGPIIIY